MWLTVLCDDELKALARLLKLGADTAREIASIRETDELEILRLAAVADEIADQLASLCGPKYREASALN